MDAETTKGVRSQEQSANDSTDAQTAKRGRKSGSSGKVSSTSEAHAIIRSAEFSPCLTYRYTLIRQWGKTPAPMLGIIGKNPSVADGERDDPTIGKEIAWGKLLKFNSFLKQNLYDYIATDSDDLITTTESLACSPENRIDKIIERLKSHHIENVLCCWGTHSHPGLKRRIRERGEALRSRLHAEGFNVICLKLTADGSPQHPLYLGFNVTPIPY